MSPRRTLPLIATLALALATGCLRPRGTADEPAIVGVEIEGARAEKPAAILRGLATRPSGRFTWDEVERLDPDAVSLDRRRIEAFYRDRGYYEARVADVRLSPQKDDRVKVTFVVEEGAPSRVSQVEVAGLEGVPVELLPKPDLKVGDVFTNAAYDGDRGALLAALRNNGWANAEVAQEARVYPAEHAVEVRYTARPGPRFRFGPIFVAGAAAVPRDRIRDQARREVKPGAWFGDESLGKAQARVFDLGVFSGVRVTRGTPDLERGIIPVIVAVREAPFRTIQAGPGVGVEANTRVDVNGAVGWINRDFLGDIRRLQLEGRAGYAWLLSTKPPKEAPVGLAAAEFSQPGVIADRIDVLVRLELEKGIEPAYDFYSERLRFGFPYRVSRRFTFVPSYNLENYTLSNPIIGFNPSVPAEQGPVLQNCNGRVCLLSYLEQRATWDGRDDPVNTRSGVYLSAALQEGFNLARYGYRYIRFVPEARGFIPIGERASLALRARIGMLAPLGEDGPPPIVARFSAGGPQSQRGYYFSRLSPMAYQNGRFIPVGGNGLADGGVELRFGVAGNWGGAVFFDAGNVASPSGVPSAWRQALDPTLLHLGTGLGARYRTPIGPIRVDVGVQLPSNWSPGVALSHRTPTLPVVNAGPVTDASGNVVGEIPSRHREPWVALHIYIGEGF